MFKDVNLMLGDPMELVCMVSSCLQYDDIGIMKKIKRLSEFLKKKNLSHIFSYFLQYYFLLNSLKNKMSENTFILFFLITNNRTKFRS